jgi:hypothetical protein
MSESKCVACLLLTKQHYACCTRAQSVLPYQVIQQCVQCHAACLDGRCSGTGVCHRDHEATNPNGHAQVRADRSISQEAVRCQYAQLPAATANRVRCHMHRRSSGLHWSAQCHCAVLCHLPRWFIANPHLPLGKYVVVIIDQHSACTTRVCLNLNAQLVLFCQARPISIEAVVQCAFGGKISLVEYLAVTTSDCTSIRVGGGLEVIWKFNRPAMVYV